LDDVFLALTGHEAEVTEATEEDPDETVSAKEASQ
jgi:hypothetical protein